jgi:serine/threonine-protein kinase
VIALLLVIGAAAWAIVNFGKSDGPNTVTIPASIIGMTEDSARAKILSLKLKPVEGATTPGPCADDQDGKPKTVCTVDPEILSQVDEHTTVTYHLYSPARVDVPLVEDKQLADALAILNENKLQGDPVRVNSPRPRGTVIRQDPKAFVPGGVPPNSTIKLFVSSGKVKLPDVRTMTFEEAQGVLNQKGFLDVRQSDTPIQTDDPNQNGVVAQESPTPGQSFDPNTTAVTLTVYQYVPPPPPTTPITTPTTPPSTPITTTTP